MTSQSREHLLRSPLVTDDACSCDQIVRSAALRIELHRQHVGDREQIGDDEADHQPGREDATARSSATTCHTKKCAISQGRSLTIGRTRMRRADARDPSLATTRIADCTFADRRLRRDALAREEIHADRQYQHAKPSNSATPVPQPSQFE